MSHKLVAKVLKKRGIKSLDELTTEERNVYDGWSAVLKGEKVTTDQILKFCGEQITLIEAKFASGDTSDKQDAYLKACLHVYLTLVKLIRAPEAEREALERYLSTLAE